MRLILLQLYCLFRLLFLLLFSIAFSLFRIRKALGSKLREMSVMLTDIFHNCSHSPYINADVTRIRS
jgi:hypothetical protein